MADDTLRRYDALWSELTHEEILLPSQQRYRIAERLRRINELGFDVDEVELIEAGEGSRLRLTTRVAEPGHHRRLLFARTGLDVGENQARRLLNDIAAFHGYLERVRATPVSDVVAANQWLMEVYEPVVRAIPAALRGRLEEAEIFHEVLDHRWLLSEAAGRDIGTTAAANDYFATILPQVPAELTVAPPVAPQPEVGQPAANRRLTTARQHKAPPASPTRHASSVNSTEAIAHLTRSPDNAST